MSVGCLICFENFESTKTVVSINGCGHVYHLQCLDEWKRSQNKLSNSCPTCRKPYNKRSIRQLYLGLAEPDVDFQKDIQNLKDEKQREYEEKILIMEEFEKARTVYEVQNQAYELLSSINNDYLDKNKKLRGENEELLEENNRIKQELEKLKIQQNQLKPHVVPSTIKDKCFDLTSDDDEIQVVASSPPQPEIAIKQIPTSIIEINDEEEDDDIFFVNNAEPETTIITTATPEIKIESSLITETEDERAAKRKSFDPCCSAGIFNKKARHDLDFLEDYILSQI